MQTKFFGNLKLRFRKLLNCRKNLEIFEIFSVILANVRNFLAKKKYYIKLELYLLNDLDRSKFG